jgi:GNAT superfamily N-acetyltransferase
MHTALLSDLALARRLERTEAHANMASVESRHRRSPAVGATWCDVDGTWAMFDGVGSPLTQTFGLGCFAAPNAAHFDAIEAFFTERGADTVQEVCSMADPAVLALLGDRGYRPVECSAVLWQPLGDADTPATTVPVRRIERGEVETWAEVAARGWAEMPELASFIREFALIGAEAEDTHAFAAEIDGVVVATGSLHLHGGVALMTGASTVPEARGQGAQRALLDARLVFAREQQAEIAMMVAAPGSASQRNAQRVGFQIAYSRVKWGRAAP